MLPVPVREVWRWPIAEETTQRITAVIRDETGTVIPGSALTSLTLTLYALDAQKTIINERERVSILNENGGSVSEGGALALLLTPEDQVIIDDTVEVERHVLLFEWIYDGGKTGRQELELKVVNLEKVPAEEDEP
jgi:hypothetical protein